MGSLVETLWKRLWCKHDWVFTRAYEVRGFNDWIRTKEIVHEHECSKCGKRKET